MEIVWSEPAYDSLTDVLDYTIEAFGLRQMVIMEDTIIDSIEQLSLYPKSCPVIAEISNEEKEYRKLVVTKEVSVIYRVEDASVIIMFVWDVRRSLHNIYYFFNHL